MITSIVICIVLVAVCAYLFAPSQSDNCKRDGIPTWLLLFWGIGMAASFAFIGLIVWALIVFATNYKG